MFITYKDSPVSGYTAISKYNATKGGGLYAMPSGGGYYNGPCGEQCKWSAGEPGPDYRTTAYVTNIKSEGPCQWSRSDSCSVGGHCAVATGAGTAATLSWPFITHVTAKTETKLTCVDGLASTQGSSETPYTKTAKLACTTSENSSGSNFKLFGSVPSHTVDCGSRTPINPISIYADGFMPIKEDSNKIANYCAYFNTDGACEQKTSCTGCFSVAWNDYDACGKAKKLEGALPAYAINADCPQYGMQGDLCEKVFILSDVGSFIQSQKDIGPFKKVSMLNLSTDKAVEFSINSGTSAPSIEETFSFENSLVTVSHLATVVKQNTISVAALNTGGLYTFTYDGEIFALTGSGTATLFHAETVKATQTRSYSSWEGPGANPCCLGSGCTYNEVGSTTTDTISAGKTYQYTHYESSLTALGEYFAPFPTSIVRTYAIAWPQFGYETMIGGSYTSADQSGEEFVCYSAYEKTTGGTTGCNCFDCIPGVDEVPIAQKGPPVSAECPQLNCGCTSTTVSTTAAGPDVDGMTNCPNTCYSQKYCRSIPPVLIETSDFDPKCGICCQTFVPLVEYSASELKNKIIRSTSCSIINQTKASFSYTHRTAVSTDYTKFYNNISYTLNTSEGIYFVSKGSISTATSFSLSQSKSGIASSDIMFGFDFFNYYWNPLGKTAQTGSDGSKKTFIALATGPATYLIGSPDGKTAKGNSSTSHDGDVHSYYISDPNQKNWNRASWPGHGVVEGKITTGTFSLSFSAGEFDNSYNGTAGFLRYAPKGGAKLTAVVPGGLNLISSKSSPAEPFKTNYSTAAFSTSFDSSFKGVWFVSVVDHSFVSTKSIHMSMGVTADHVQVCTGDCGHSDPVKNQVHLNYWFPGGITNTSEYFIKGEKSLLYMNNSMSYLWTNPASKKHWGTGHAGYCN